MAKRLRELVPSARAAVERLRAAAESLAGVVETVSFGNPTFGVGHKTIAVVDRYNGRECLWLRVSQSVQGIRHTICAQEVSFERRRATHDNRHPHAGGIQAQMPLKEILFSS
jgi:hypothetical protein